jgi:LacI family transcriptional regulator
MRVTIEDVSRAAGVSIKTVSRVLNKEKYVAQLTQERVEAAVAALGFRPNFAARALAGHKSFQIALITDNPSPYYAQNIQAGVRARCLESGYRMIAQPCDAQSPSVLEEICSLIDQAQLDGVILTPPFTENDAIRAELSARGVRYVMTSPADTDVAQSSVTIGHAEGAKELTAYLISLGHRRIGFVEGDPRYATSARRLAGYQAALQVAEIEFDSALVQPGLYDFQSGSQAAQALLALDRPPTAIFASSDDMAAGVLAAAHRLGFVIPEQLSVAGFDDTDLATVVWPPLTTIRQPVRDMGYAAADLLLAPGDAPEHRALAHELIVRDSTSPPHHSSAGRD